MLLSFAATYRELKRRVPIALKSDHVSTQTAATEVLLYENTKAKPKYFKLIAIVSVIQLFFWTYLSYFALTEFNGKTNQPTKREHKTEASSSATQSNGNTWFTSSKWRIAMSLLSLSAGVFFAITANMYPLRCIHRLYFIQRSSAAQIHTYTPLGSVRKLQVPLNDITCTGDRSSARAQLALKVKDYPLFFLLDRQGQFVAPRMFDTLIASRKKVV